MMEIYDVKKTTGKPKRQAAIRSILNSKSGTTQNEIIKYLNEKGIKTFTGKKWDSRSQVKRLLDKLGLRTKNALLIEQNQEL